MHFTLSRCVVIAMLAIAMVPVAESVAVAGPESDDRSRRPVALANPQISDELLAALPESVLNESTLWVDPNIPPGTPFLVVGPDGKLSVAPGQSAAQVARAESILQAGGLPACRTRATVPIRTTVVVNSGCAAVIGTSPSTTVTYSVETTPPSNGHVSWVPWSFKREKKNIARPPLKPNYQWVYTGQWNSTGGVPGMRVRVQWGEVAAVPKVKFTNGSPIYGWIGTFQY